MNVVRSVRGVRNGNARHDPYDREQQHADMEISEAVGRIIDARHRSCSAWRMTPSATAASAIASR